VSLDGGITWRPAQGTTAWTFEWSAGTLGTASIRARAIDDSGNQEAPGASISVSVVAGRCPCPSIWSASTVPAVPDADDSSPVELGLKFRSDVDGFVKGVRFYKGLGNSGTHVGNLWTSGGSLLARGTFSAETAAGWQQVLFDEPVEIAANLTYVVSYHTNVGHYAASAGYFATLGADAPPLHALSSGAAGGNGVYKYGPTDFPTDTFNATNYYVDVVFDSTTDTTGPAIGDVAATAVDSSTAVISWTTNEPATSNVDYSTDGTFPPALTLHASNPALTLPANISPPQMVPSSPYPVPSKAISAWCADARVSVGAKASVLVGARPTVICGSTMVSRCPRLSPVMWMKTARMRNAVPFNRGLPDQQAHQSQNMLLQSLTYDAFPKMMSDL